MNYAEIANNLSTTEIVGLLKIKEQFLDMQARLEQTEQTLNWFKQQLFGKKSEKRPAVELPTVGIQLYLNQELETASYIAEQKASTIKSEVKPYQRGKAKKLDLANQVSETGLRFNDEVPVKTIKVPNKQTEGLKPDEYEIVSTKVVHRLAQTNCYQVLKYEQDVIKIKANKEVINTPAPTSVFDNSFADVSFLARLVVDKFLYHLPLYRQEQRLKASGIKLSRGTLIEYVCRIALLLKPIYEAQMLSILESLILAMDEVPVKAGVDGAKSKMKKGYFWPMYGDKQELAFHFAPSRSTKVLTELLKDNFNGTLLTDGYTAYAEYTNASKTVIHALCWSHARRYFIKAEKVEPRLVPEALGYIQKLYKIEEEIRGKDSLSRQEIRGSESKKIVDDYFAWLRTQQAQNSLLPSSPFTKAVHYSLEREAGLRTFLANPDLALDTNHVERQIRPVVIGRKNWLFCFSESGAENAGIIYSLIATCTLHGVDPCTYLIDVLQRVQTHPNSKIAELTPRLWKEHFGHCPLKSDVDL